VTRRLVVFCLALCLFATGCATTLENYKANSAEEAQVLAALMRIPNGIKARSVETILLAYADDAYIGNFYKNIGIASPGERTSMKKADLRYVYADLFKNTKDVALEVKGFRLSVSGNRAVAEGDAEFLLKLEGGRQDKREEILRNSILWRLQRTPHGWRIKEEIYQ
jgi:hypothetical protein